MKIKKNDNVLVIAGKDKGKKGKIMQIFSKEKVVVEGVNKLYKHTKPRKGKEKGERIEFNAPLYSSNLMLICPKCNKPTRIGVKVEGKKRQRICRKCKSNL